MNAQRAALWLVGWLYGSLGFAIAQHSTATVTGRVLDAKTGEPLPFATVYINNSSRGTAADEHGRYQLTHVPLGSHELVGSVLGYKVVRQPLRLVDVQPRTIDLRLEPTDQALAAVTVTARHSSAWSRQFRTFSRELLGNRPQARQCRILNPNVLSFQEEKGHLRAQASEPLVIENGALGYQLHYNLLFFDLYQGKMQFAGTARFEELPSTSTQQKAVWQANRLKVYQGSLQHLLVNLLAGTHEQAGYVVYRAPLASNASDQSMPIVGIGDRQYIGKERAQGLFKSADLPFERRLQSDQPLEVYYNRVYAANSPYRDLPYAYSLLLLPKGFVDLTVDGGITQGNGLDVRGYLGNDRLATLLPTDWTLPGAEVITASDVVAGRPGRADAGVDSLVAMRLRQAERTPPLVYIHTDKTLYCAGDQLWLSAYVLDPARQLPVAGRSGTALQVELIAPTGRAVQHQWVRLLDGRAAANVRLADTLSPGTYHLRAYTALDQEANGPAFECSFPVYNVRQSGAHVLAADEVASFTNASVVAPSAAVVDVQFLPEGGRWLADVAGRVGIKAVGPDGYGRALRGRIIDQRGADVAQFTTNWLGIGQVSMTPKAGQRYVAIVDASAGKASQSVALPAVEPEGWALAVDAVSDSSRLTVTVRATGRYTQQPVYITLQSREQFVYNQKWTLTNGAATFSLSAASLPPGVCRLTLWDAASQPRAERLVFVPERVAGTSLRISLSKPQYTAREQVAVGVQFRDENGYPVLGSWSAAVTDADQLPADTAQVDMRTYLLLTAGLRGVVESPTYYLQNAHRQDLDNLLLTQGWRRLPAPVGAGSLTGWALGGHVRDGRGKPIANAAVLLELEQDGQKLMQSRTTDDKGRFQLKGLLNQDTIQVKGSVPGADPSETRLTFDAPGLPFAAPKASVPNWAALRPWLNEAETRQAAWPALYRDSTARQLAEVIVRANKRPSERPLDVQRSSLHGMADGVLVVDRNTAASALTLFDLIKRVPGMQLIGGQIRLNGIGSFGDNTPLYIVDGVYVDEHVLAEINPLQVSRIELLKHSSAAMYGARAAGGIIAIYLTKGSSGVPTIRSGVSALVPGFATSREFYTPRYEPTASETLKDRRDVVYWQPLGQNDADGQARLLFQLNDTTRRLRLVIQGITSEGAPISATWELPVRP
ncbi:carboxypeptidase regulatory-like domain-containing protein [Fibrella sp. WM1]|uniref:carboxypeptidase regulatory-like domain-containing protein n=1 Tax=Fibrella musci TaxID=3242485 RepID=UPI003520EF47